MTRLPIAALAVLLGAGTAQAQSKTDQDVKKPAAPADVDRQIQEAVQKEVAKVKEQLRDEVRAEIQGAQSAAAFLGTDEEKPKLQFLEFNGYLRFRWDLLNNMTLKRGADSLGYYLSPPAIQGTDSRGTQTGANMRFRLDPTINVSDEVRVRATLDMLDNVILGSSPRPPPYGDPSAGTFPGPTQTSPASGTQNLAVKRAWAEVQTPIGMISFGRMPSQWGLGIYSHAGNGIDDDYGDSVDRLQLAIPIGQIVGGLVLIPMWDFAASGLTSAALPQNYALGQPIDIDQSDDVGAIGVKVVRQDTADELRRKLEKGLTSINYGAWFNYRSQRFALLPVGTTTCTGTATQGYCPVNRDAGASTLDLWGRFESRRLKLEAEVVGIYGSIANVAQVGEAPQGPILLRQFGGALRGEVKFYDGRLRVGAEVGVASGDRAPGFGNYPGRTGSTPATSQPSPGDYDGRQYNCIGTGAGAGTCSDSDIRNYRFNQAYRVDQILWRQIVGGVTEAFYLKPTFRWDILEGVGLNAQVVYSQALHPESTPSTTHAPLGVELDIGFSYASDDGFMAWLSYGFLVPLAGFDFAPTSPLTSSLASAHALRTGLAVKF
jgi:uncharacterized protein (TIGR04551 family)